METRTWILQYYRLEVETGVIWHVTQEIELPSDYHQHEESGIFRVGEEVVFLNRLHYDNNYRSLFRIPTQYLTLASPEYPFQIRPQDTSIEYRRERFLVAE